MKKLLLTLAALLWALPAIAGPNHGLSLYGPQGLKYKPGEPYAYANPAAPKGGQLVLADFGVQRTYVGKRIRDGDLKRSAADFDRVSQFIRSRVDDMHRVLAGVGEEPPSTVTRKTHRAYSR